MKPNRMIDPRKVYGPNEAPPELVALIVPELARLTQEEKSTRQKTEAIKLIC